MTDASSEGQTFGFCTNFRTFDTAATEQGLFYMKSEEEEIRINSFRLSSTVDCFFRVRVDIEGGTLRDSGSAFSMNNFNRSSNREFSGTVIRGSTDLTVGWYPHLVCISASAYTPVIVPFEDSLILTKGDSLAVTIEPTAACKASCAGILYVADH